MTSVTVVNVVTVKELVMRMSNKLENNKAYSILDNKSRVIAPYSLTLSMRLAIQLGTFVAKLKNLFN